MNKIYLICDLSVLILLSFSTYIVINFFFYLNWNYLGSESARIFEKQLMHFRYFYPSPKCLRCTRNYINYMQMINDLLRWERFCVSYSNPFHSYVYECHNEVEWTVYIKICKWNGDIYILYTVYTSLKGICCEYFQCFIFWNVFIMVKS